MTKPEPETLSLAIRMSPTMRNRLDELTNLMMADNDINSKIAGKLTRASVIRIALGHGVEFLEKKCMASLMTSQAKDVVFANMQEHQKYQSPTGPGSADQSAALKMMRASSERRCEKRAALLR